MARGGRAARRSPGRWAGGAATEVWTQADVEADLLDCKAELERAVAAGKAIHFCIVM